MPEFDGEYPSIYLKAQNCQNSETKHFTDKSI